MEASSTAASGSAELARRISGTNAIALVVAIAPLPAGLYTYLRLWIIGSALIVFFASGQSELRVRRWLYPILASPFAILWKLDKGSWVVLDLALAVAYVAMWLVESWNSLDRAAALGRLKVAGIVGSILVISAVLYAVHENSARQSEAGPDEQSRTSAVVKQPAGADAGPYLDLDPGPKTVIDSEIQTRLPHGAALREVRAFAGSPDESYLALYIVHPLLDSIAPVDSVQLPKGGYLRTRYESCPESRGQRLTGEYHLLLYRSHRIVNEVLLPLDSLAGDGTDAASALSLSFRNTRWNLYSRYGGTKPSDSDDRASVDLQPTRLLNLGRFTAEANGKSFVLPGSTYPCGFTRFVVAGYDPETDQAVVYPIIDDTVTRAHQYWSTNFVPDSLGHVVQRLGGCDHGGDGPDVRRIYDFDRGRRAYVFSHRELFDCAGKALVDKP